MRQNRRTSSKSTTDIAAAAVVNDNNNNYDDDDELHDHPLVGFGKNLERLILHEFSTQQHQHQQQPSGRKNNIDNETDPPLKIVDALCTAHEAWTTDWDIVTQSIEDASIVLSDCMNSDVKISSSDDTCDDNNTTTMIITTVLHDLFDTIQYQFKDLSTIEGCTSVGPLSSIPNWISIQESIHVATTTLLREKQQQQQQQHDRLTMIIYLLEQSSNQLDRWIESI